MALLYRLARTVIGAASVDQVFDAALDAIGAALATERPRSWCSIARRDAVSGLAGPVRRLPARRRGALALEARRTSDPQPVT